MFTSYFLSLYIVSFNLGQTSQCVNCCFFSTTVLNKAKGLVSPSLLNVYSKTLALARDIGLIPQSLSLFTDPSQQCIRIEVSFFLEPRLYKLMRDLHLYTDGWTILYLLFTYKLMIKNNMSAMS